MGELFRRAVKYLVEGYFSSYCSICYSTKTAKT